MVKRILVPLDGFATEEAAIPHAQALAQVLGAGLVLFHVVEPFTGRPQDSEAFPMCPPENEEQRSDSAFAYLDTVKKALQEKGLSTSTEVDSRSASVKILEYAEASTIDLIAMSTNGRSGIGRWIFGSVTEKVLHAEATPVLTVQATKA